MAAKGMDVILKSSSQGSFRLTLVKESDVVMSGEEFFTRSTIVLSCKLKRER